MTYLVVAVVGMLKPGPVHIGMANRGTGLRLQAIIAGCDPAAARPFLLQPSGGLWRIRGPW